MRQDTTKVTIKGQQKVLYTSKLLAHQKPNRLVPKATTLDDLEDLVLLFMYFQFHIQPAIDR